MNNLYRWKMSQKISMNDFEYGKDKFKFDKKFIGNYDEKGDKTSQQDTNTC